MTPTDRRGKKQLDRGSEEEEEETKLAVCPNQGSALALAKVAPKVVVADHRCATLIIGQKDA